jgi:hypothetical protein
VIKEGALHGVEALVTKVIMSTTDKGKALVSGDIKLVPSLFLPLPEPTIENKKTSHYPKELC